MAILIYYFLFVLIIIPHEAYSISFNFPIISPQIQNIDINVRNNAFIDNQGLLLTPGQSWTSGRGTYVKKLHIWDKASGELASFSTNFSFVIEPFPDDNTFRTDGFTFFLAENTSVQHWGEALGLPVEYPTRKPLFPYLAVEFDTWWNSEFDPPDLSSDDDYHVGINVNSLESSRFKKWSMNITKAAHCNASVTYDSGSKNLGVSVTDGVNGVIDLSYIIDLRNVLPEWVAFGFTAGTTNRFEKITVTSWSFNSSNLQADEPIKAPSSAPGPEKRAGHKISNKHGLIVGLVVGVLSFSAIVVFYYLYWRRNKHGSHGVGYDAGMNKDFEQGTGPKRFSYSELLLATASFAEMNKLGEGGFGGVYKGLLKDQKTYIAVKRVSKKSQQGTKEYTAEVKIFGRLRHKNLVELKGWCHEKSELLLIYEFMENGSLDLHLFKQRSWLSWDKRKRIAYGLASVVSYLHEGCKECILHRDIKSSNVMLDSNFDAKLGDFGLAKLVDHEKSSEETRVVGGTRGYMAPEYVSTGKASKESDVYSFVVVALEIACGRKPIDYEAPERPVILVEWVRDLYETGNILKAIDPSLVLDNKEQIERLMIVGLWCAHPVAEQRPSMEHVIQVLNYDISKPQLSKLPSKMPKNTSNAPPNPPVFYSILDPKS